jgi:hypothetical protein
LAGRLCAGQRVGRAHADDGLCLSIAEHEADIYELFVEAPCPESGADWLIRGQHDRLVSDGTKLRERLVKAPMLTEMRFGEPGSAGRAARPVHQQLKSVRVTLKAPSRPDRTLLDVEVTAILATEINPPDGQEPVEWLLLTNLSVYTAEQAIEKLQWYLYRWQIEIYFKILKSGCRIEELQLEKLERLEPALALYRQLSPAVSSFSPCSGATVRKCPAMSFSPSPSGRRFTSSPSANRPGKASVPRPNGSHGCRSRWLPEPQARRLPRCSDPMDWLAARR